MRYGVISDVHGNLPALEAALQVLARAGVDRHLCLGDLVGYGAFPNECVREVQALGAWCVAGNHDLIAAGQLDAGGTGPLARETLAWTREVLAADARRFLARLPQLAVPEPRIVMAHGAVEDPRRYIRRPDQAAEQLRRLAHEHPSAELLLLGHTHRPRAYAERMGQLRRQALGPLALPRGRRVLVNPGSVGQSRSASPHGRVLVLDTDAWTVRWHAVRYDRAAYRRALRAAGLPDRSHHRNPYAPSALRRRANRALRRSRTRVLGPDGRRR